MEIKGMQRSISSIRTGVIRTRFERNSTQLDRRLMLSIKSMDDFLFV